MITRQAVRIGDIADMCLGKMLDQKKNRGTYQKYLGNSNVRWGEFDLNDLAEMRFEDSEQERYGVKKGDLIVCEGGEPGRCAIWKEELPNMMIQKALHRVRGKEGKLSNLYLFYWLMLTGKNGSLEPHFTGTTIKHLTGVALSNIKIPLPPLDEQQAIASVLSSLDDKIDSLHRQNKTLEAMAECLFKEMFEYDEKRSNGNTRLGNVLQLSYGKALSESDRSGFGFPVFGSNGVIGYHDEFLVKGPGLITGRKGTLGKVMLSREDFWAIDTTFYVETCLSFFPIYYFYFLLSRLKLGEMNSDSAVPGLNRNSAHDIEIPNVTTADIECFEGKVSPFFSKIMLNQRQANTLENLRDTLLPKLMSGEVRVEV